MSVSSCDLCVSLQPCMSKTQDPLIFDCFTFFVLVFISLTIIQLTDPLIMSVDNLIIEINFIKLCISKQGHKVLHRNGKGRKT